MEKISEILNSKIKPKEKTAQLVLALQQGEISVAQLLDFFRQAKDPEKGTCLSGLTQITKDNPAFVKDHIDFIISQLTYKAPRVKWEAAETIANISKGYPDKAAKAIPNLLAISEDEGTVVRWSAALALTEIAKNNPETRKELVPYIEKKAVTETQNGVKKIYAKALKAIKKEKA